MYTESLKIKGLANARDLGGMPVNGGKIVCGKLFRSGKLYGLSKGAKDDLKALGLEYIIDFRIDAEVKKHPDSELEGVKYVRLPLSFTANAGITREESLHAIMRPEGRRIGKQFKTAEEYMSAYYEELLFGRYSRDILGQFFKILIKADGGVLFHCSGGKDRAGIAAMLSEGLLGASDDLICADYALSEKLQRRHWGWRKAFLAISPARRGMMKILIEMMRAPESYPRRALAAIRQRYGTVENYCREGLKLGDGVEKLRQKYIEEN